jgi:tetratricopeptide (TPR) repeat protein
MNKSLLILAIVLSLAAAQAAQDYVKTKNREYRGKVKSADRKSVTIEIPEVGSMSIPRETIIKLEVEAPPNVLRGIEAYEKGNYRDARAALANMVYQYQGLDTVWAEKALNYYARCCLMSGDLGNAEKAFGVFIAAYDEDEPLALDAAIGLAETEVARQNIDKALPKFQELADEFGKQLKPSKEELPYAGAVFLGLGKCLEEKKDVDGALQAYLKVIALYPNDNVLPETLYRTALIYQRQNKPERSLVYLNDLTAQFPSSPYAEKAAALKKGMETKGEKDTK